MRGHLIMTNGRILKVVALSALSASVIIGLQGSVAAYTKEQCGMQHQLNVAGCKETFAGSNDLTTQDRYNCVSTVNGQYLDCLAAASDAKSNAGGGSSTGGKSGPTHSPIQAVQPSAGAKQPPSGGSKVLAPTTNAPSR